ncbi:hypothetical protein AB833_29435 [Chromatiales bacterium (ex Bugula neritina AB1)]|nr:hypothetical protein AB833_29435 [Chromatiales bacterium (ex Bugula neritina AB1)]
MFDQISVVIICKNSAKTLARTLESVSAFSEVVVYDNGSTDKTPEIAKLYSNVCLYQGEFEGFGKTKQKAVNAATHDWVLSLDADECISGHLLEELRSWQPGSHNIAGWILRDNYLMGRHAGHGSWARDWLLRLFNRKAHGFNDSPVHEKVIAYSDSQKKYFRGTIKHNAVQELGQFLVKIDRYTEIRRKESSKTFHPTIIVLRSLIAFIKGYIIRCGFLDGWRGLVIAWNDANGTFYKYIKRYADRAVEKEQQEDNADSSP